MSQKSTNRRSSIWATEDIVFNIYIKANCVYVMYPQYYYFTVTVQYCCEKSPNSINQAAVKATHKDLKHKRVEAECSASHLKLLIYEFRKRHEISTPDQQSQSIFFTLQEMKRLQCQLIYHYYLSWLPSTILPGLAYFHGGFIKKHDDVLLFSATSGREKSPLDWQ